MSVKTRGLQNMSVENLVGEAEDSPLTILKTFLAKQDLPSGRC